MQEFFANTVSAIEKLTFFCAIGLALEHLRPADKDQPAKGIIFNFFWLINFILMTNFLMLFFGRFIQMGVAALHGPLFTIHFPNSILGDIGQFFTLMLIYDFLYYCFHRAQHTWPWFWAHHKLHHTEEHMNATTSFRHHWMENLYRIPFIYIPMGLVNIDGSVTALAGDINLLWAIFTHMNLRLELGPLTPVFGGPQIHRIHHSSLPEHSNRNFCAFFPIWDILLGTYFKPRPNEFPPCGLTPSEVTDSLWQANVGVFKDWAAMFRQRFGKPVVAKQLRDEVV